MKVYVVIYHSLDNLQAIQRVYAIRSIAEEYVKECGWHSEIHHYEIEECEVRYD